MGGAGEGGLAEPQISGSMETVGGGSFALDTQALEISAGGNNKTPVFVPALFFFKRESYKVK